MSWDSNRGQRSDTAHKATFILMYFAFPAGEVAKTLQITGQNLPKTGTHPGFHTSVSSSFQQEFNTFFTSIFTGQV